MARIPDQIIEQVREAHDIVDVVGRAVQLKRAGAGYKGLCPFHDEKTPSFTVHPGRQTYKCFGCNKGGNVLTFVMDTQGLTFPESVRQLAEERGIQVPDSASHDPQMDQRMEALRNALRLAHRFFVETLATAEGAEARAYLEKRGYDEKAVKEFGLGYAPDSWDRLRLAAKNAGVSERALDDAGLVRTRSSGDGFYDYFRHRIIFPIADAQGRLVTFAGRALDPEDPAKYMNGPETAVFKKSAVLYGYHKAREAIRRKGEALLMEGYTDVLMCQLHGFDHAIAGMGTAFTERQAGLLRRVVDRVVLLYDADSAGQKAAERALEILLEKGMEVRIALLPEGRDVDEILLEEGPESLDAILAESRDIFEFKLGLLGGKYDLTTPRGRAKASEELVALATHVESAIERDQLLRTIAERLGGGPASEAVLRKEAARQLTRRRPGAPTPSGSGGHGASHGASSGVSPGAGLPGASGAPTDEPPPSGPVGKLESAMAGIRDHQRALEEQDLLSAVLQLPDLRDLVFRAVGPEEFSAGARARLYDALLLLWEHDGEIEFRSVMTRFQGDPEVTALLAGLPDDEPLAERVTCQIEHVERRRAAIQHQREVVRMAGGRDTQGVAGPGDSPAIAGSRGVSADPDDSYYDDDVVPDVDPSGVPLRGADAGDADGMEAF